MNNIPENKNLMSTAAQNALIAAIANIAGVLTLYFMGPQYFAPNIPNFILIFALFLIPVAISVWSALQLRKLNGGFISMKELFKYMFLTFVIVETVYVVFNVVLFKYIDPDFMRQVVVVSVKTMSKFMHDQGMDQETIKTSITKMTAGFDNMFSFGKISLNWATSLLKDALVAVIIAAIVKRNKPEEMPVIYDTNTPAS